MGNFLINLGNSILFTSDPAIIVRMTQEDRQKNRQVERPSCNQEVASLSLSWARGVKALDKFLTPMCLCHQAAQVGIGLRAVTPDGWEGNCGPGE